MAAGRRNGWQKPFASQFILLQAIFYSSALIFYLYIQFIQQPQWFIIGESSEMLFGPMRITLLVVASISLLIAYSSSMYASIKDPGDPIIYHLECEQGQLKKYCEICKSSVHDQTMHCKYCDKCILRLDHHCFYLNNCIGRLNYRAYIVTIWSGAVYFICVSVGGWFALAVYTHPISRPVLESAVTSLFGNNGEWLTVLFTVLSTIVAALSTLFSIFLINLCILHIVLGIKGMTTLEYSRLLRRRAQEAEARQLIRQSQLTRHNNEGRFSRLFKWGPFNKRGRVHPVGASQTTQDKVLVAQQQQSSPSEKFTSPPLSGDDSTSILPR